MIDVWFLWPKCVREWIRPVCLLLWLRTAACQRWGGNHSAHRAEVLPVPVPRWHFRNDKSSALPGATASLEPASVCGRLLLLITAIILLQFNPCLNGRELTRKPLKTCAEWPVIFPHLSPVLSFKSSWWQKTTPAFIRRHICFMCPSQVTCGVAHGFKTPSPLHNGLSPGSFYALNAP